MAYQQVEVGGADKSLPQHREDERYRVPAHAPSKQEAHTHQVSTRE